MMPRATKMPCQDVTFSTALPRLGAAIGATPKTRTSREKYFAAATPEYRSRTIGPGHHDADAARDALRQAEPGQDRGVRGERAEEARRPRTRRRR